MNDRKPFQAGARDSAAAVVAARAAGHTPGQRAANAVLTAVFDRCTLRPGCSTRGMFSEIEGIIDRETASPELLTALKAMDVAFSDLPEEFIKNWRDRRDAVITARAAIAKAEGIA